MQETQVQFLCWEDPLEKKMEAHSSILAWRIPWMKDHLRLQSMGSQRVRHDWTTNTFIFIMFKMVWKNGIHTVWGEGINWYNVLNDNLAKSIKFKRPHILLLRYFSARKLSYINTQHVHKDVCPKWLWQFCL